MRIMLNKVKDIFFKKGRKTLGENHRRRKTSGAHKKCLSHSKDHLIFVFKALNFVHFDTI